VAVDVKVGVGVAVCAGVGVLVLVAVLVDVDVLVAVFVAVLVAVFVGVGVTDGDGVGVAVGALKVTVTVAFEPRTTLHGLFVVVQPGAGLAVRALCPLHPAKADPAAGTALRVTTALLSDVVIFGEQVLVTVCVAAAEPVPPQDRGAFTVPVLTVITTEPAPVPANARVQLRASVNVPASVTAESNPLAIYAYAPIARSSSQSVIWHDHAPFASAVAAHDDS
jgi:hypothetical protein